MTFEMFLWQKPFILRAFRMTPEFAERSRALAANQGLYNGFLAVGLAWGVCTDDEALAHSVSLFFTGCMAVAGIFGALTASKKIFFVQAVPALIGLVLLYNR